MGFVAPQHVGSSRARARTRVTCIGRRILNHCAIYCNMIKPLFLFLFLNKFIYLFLAALGIVRRLLIAVASLVAEHRL